MGHDVWRGFDFAHLVMKDIDSGIMDVMRGRYASSADADPARAPSAEVADAKKRCRSSRTTPSPSSSTREPWTPAGDQHKLDMLRECARVLTSNEGEYCLHILPRRRARRPPRARARNSHSRAIAFASLPRTDPKYGHASVFVAVLGRGLEDTASPRFVPRGRGRGRGYPRGRGLGDRRATEARDALTATVLARVRASGSLIEDEPPGEEDELTHVRRVRLGVRSAREFEPGVYARSRKMERDASVPGPSRGGVKNAPRRGTRRSRRNDSLQIRTPSMASRLDALDTAPATRLVSSRKCSSRALASATEPTGAVPFALSSAERRRRRSAGDPRSTPSGLTRSSAAAAISPSPVADPRVPLPSAFSAPHPRRGVVARRRAFAGRSRLSPGRAASSWRRLPQLGGSRGALRSASLAAAPMPRPSQHSASGVASLGLRRPGSRMTVPGWTLDVVYAILVPVEGSSRATSASSPSPCGSLASHELPVWPSPRVLDRLASPRGGVSPRLGARVAAVECILCSVGGDAVDAVSASWIATGGWRTSRWKGGWSPDSP